MTAVRESDSSSDRCVSCWEDVIVMGVVRVG